MSPLIAEECRLWSSSFALDPPIVEGAIEGYISMLEGLDDADVVRGLAKLRRDIHKLLSNADEVPNHAALLDEMMGRLDRSLERATLLEGAGLAEGLEGLSKRLLAARALVGAVRAALARRGRRP